MFYSSKFISFFRMLYRFLINSYIYNFFKTIFCSIANCYTYSSFKKITCNFFNYNSIQSSIFYKITAGTCKRIAIYFVCKLNKTISCSLSNSFTVKLCTKLKYYCISFKNKLFENSFCYKVVYTFWNNAE